MNSLPLQFLFFFLAGTLCASPVKLALLGERNLCDKTTAKLNENEEFDLLERAEIDRVMKEHELQTNGLSATVLKRLTVLKRKGGPPGKTTRAPTLLLSGWREFRSLNA